MHEMRLLRSMYPAYVCQPVSQSVYHKASCGFADQVEVQLAVKILGGPRYRYIVLNGGPGPPTTRGGDMMRPSPTYFGYLLNEHTNVGRLHIHRRLHIGPSRAKTAAAVTGYRNISSDTVTHKGTEETQLQFSIAYVSC